MKKQYLPFPIFIAAFKVKENEFKTVDLAPDDIIMSTHIEKLNAVVVMPNGAKYFLGHNSRIFKKDLVHPKFISVTGVNYVEITDLVKALKTNCGGKVPVFLLTSEFKSQNPLFALVTENQKDFTYKIERSPFDFSNFKNY